MTYEYRLMGWEPRKTVFSLDHFKEWYEITPEMETKIKKKFGLKELTNEAVEETGESEEEVLIAILDLLDGTHDLDYNERSGEYTIWKKTINKFQKHDATISFRIDHEIKEVYDELSKKDKKIVKDYFNKWLKRKLRAMKRK